MVAVLAEGRWFDATRHVETRGIIPLNKLTLVGAAKSGFPYMPARPAGARRAINALPLHNPADYTFVDLGSGKGRVLFLAAEYPFRRILGVEFAVELHQAAQRNIQRYRYFKRRCKNIESLNMDASEFEFPNENLVIHLFDPFGGAVMEKVLDNLAASLRRNPRHIIVTMLYPEYATVLSGRAELRPYRLTSRYHIYQTPPLT
jgi:SAM-dependent methyltransferase